MLFRSHLDNPLARIPAKTATAGVVLWVRNLCCRIGRGPGKLGDLAGFTSAVILAMIAVLIGYEAVGRFIHPVPIHFREAIPSPLSALLST